MDRKPSNRARYEPGTPSTLRRERSVFAAHHRIPQPPLDFGEPSRIHHHPNLLFFRPAAEHLQTPTSPRRRSGLDLDRQMSITEVSSPVMYLPRTTYMSPHEPFTSTAPLEISRWSLSSVDSGSPLASSAALPEFLRSSSHTQTPSPQPSRGSSTFATWVQADAQLTSSSSPPTSEVSLSQFPKVPSFKLRGKSRPNAEAHHSPPPRGEILSDTQITSIGVPALRRRNAVNFPARPSRVPHSTDSSSSNSSQAESDLFITHHEPTPRPLRYTIRNPNPGNASYPLPRAFRDESTQTANIAAEAAMTFVPRRMSLRKKIGYKLRGFAKRGRGLSVGSWFGGRDTRSARSFQVVQGSERSSEMS